MTETGNPSTVMPFPAVRLSEFLAGCHTTELLRFFEDYQEGLSTTLIACAVKGETFTVSVTGLNGHTCEFTKPEELIFDTPEARQWRETKAKESQLAIMECNGGFAVDADILNDTTGKLERLCLMRRAYINRRGPVREPLIPAHVLGAGVPRKGSGVPKKNSGNIREKPRVIPELDLASADLARLLDGTSEPTDT